MDRIDDLQRAWPLHTAAATRDIESRAASQLAPHELMRRAGRSVARLALALAPHARTVHIACGPGNNGGDGFEAAIHLQAAGRAVRVWRVGASDAMPSDAADALNRAQAAGIGITSAPESLGTGCDLAIDALLGIGASRPPEGDMADAVRSLQRVHDRVLSVDVPSGLDASSGRTPAGEAVHAAHTLSLLTLKPGLFTASGRDHAGEVWFDDLGVAADDASACAMLTGPAVGAPTAGRRHAQHKGSFGDVLVIGGASGMAGAGLLAGRAALAAGAGRVFIDLLDATAPDFDIGQPELMLRPGRRHSLREERGGTTVVCGCGGGEAVHDALPVVLSVAERAVLDADALNAVAADATLQRLLERRLAQGRRTVLTPHPLEAARLLGLSAPQVQADRLGAAQALASRFNCVAVLKGSGTVIAGGGTRPWINPTGNAALATAGTGDVLAGWIGGEWAQATHGSVEETSSLAARAVFVHGLAALGVPAPLRASRLIEAMRTLR